MTVLLILTGFAFGVLGAVGSARVNLNLFMDHSLRIRDKGMPALSSRNLQTLASDLRRLDAQYRQMERSPEMAKHFHMEAVRMAYDDTLIECCKVLDLKMEERRPLGAPERLQLEAELARNGLTW